MTKPSERPMIYHITHVDNLHGIVADGGLVSDAEMMARGGAAAPIGMSHIKMRRVEQLKLDCHPGTMVGDYVPFYFCSRSIMLYVIYQKNHPKLTYRGGQGPIVHLVADLHAVVEWARAPERRWAFSLSNAGAFYTQFRSRVEDLEELDWPAIAATDWRSADVKEGKQAEFLVHERFPWDLVIRIGVRSGDIRERVAVALRDATHRPAVEIKSDWYY